MPYEAPMRRALPVTLALLAALALAACRDEPSVAEQFNTLRADVENKAQEYDANAENLVASEERRLADEANTLLQQNANLFGNAAETQVDVNSGTVDINAH
jgi:predicted trehalose synthase